MADRHKIKCAHCKEHHDTVAQVRLCGQRDNARKALQRAADEDAAAEIDADARYERYLEDGGAHAAVIQWENEQDRLREGLPFA